MSLVKRKNKTSNKIKSFSFYIKEHFDKTFLHIDNNFIKK